MTPIETSTVGAVTLALDAALLRHQAIAANIANVNTPGYRPVRVSFEEHLGTQPARLERVEGDSKVELDVEVAHLSANTVHYQALLRALNKQLSILGTAINEGKR
jgi:flagellar basal-body rod protein FlgB